MLLASSARGCWPAGYPSASAVRQGGGGAALAMRRLASPAAAPAFNDGLLTLTRLSYSSRQDKCSSLSPLKMIKSSPWT